MPGPRFVPPEVQPLLPRLLHFGVAYGDLLERPVNGTAEPWGARLAARAAGYEAAADRAWEEGRRQSAFGGWRLAKDSYHFAQLRMPFGEEKSLLRAACRRAFAKLVSRFDPPAERFELSLDGLVVPGYFRSGQACGGTVILIGGLDSAKEVELAYFAEVFWRRGCSVLFFDGPGQGELLGQAPMPIRFERVVSALVDELVARGGGAEGRLGVFGVSFGGHLACRAAAADDRFCAAVSLGGFHDGRIFERISPLGGETFVRTFGLAGPEALPGLARELTLTSLPGLRSGRLLVVHGSEDLLVDDAQVEAMARWVGSRGELLVLDGAEHVCADRFADCLPQIGDFMAAALRGEATSPSLGEGARP